MRAQQEGKKAELAVASLLRARGHSVEVMSYKCEYDFLVDGKRVELKRGRPRFFRGSPVWSFNIHRHGQLKEECDLYIFRLEGIPGFTKAIHLLVPAPIGRTVFRTSFRSLLNGHIAHVQAFHNLFGKDSHAKGT